MYLAIVDGVPEELVAEEVLELRVLVVGLLDVAQEDAPDDAAAAPHQRDRAVVQLPREQLRGLAQQHETLNEVGAQFNGSGFWFESEFLFHCMLTSPFNELTKANLRNWNKVQRCKLKLFLGNVPQFKQPLEALRQEQ